MCELLDDSQPFYLFISVDTDGVGTFQPFTQKVVRVGLIMTDAAFQDLSVEHFFVRGATRLAHNINHYTIEQINQGLSPVDAGMLVLARIQQVLWNKGLLVAHNTEFVANALASLGVYNVSKNMYCTMKNSVIVCKNCKYPQLVELCTFMYPLIAFTASQCQKVDDKVELLKCCFQKGKEILLFETKNK